MFSHFLIFKRFKVMSKQDNIIKPSRIRIDVSTVCQLKCPCCPTASGGIAKFIGSGFLKFRDFKKLIDRNPWIEVIELSNWGEIFLNPDLEKQ